MLRKTTFSILAFVLLTDISHAALNDSAVKTKWGYRGGIGPERWAQLSNSFSLCATGKSQSPIDLLKKTEKTPQQLSFDYHSAPMLIMDDGETQLQLGEDQTIINDGHGIQLNFHHDAREFITFADKKYELLQFHFHSPSENEWHGRAFPLEIHFVHQGAEGKVAVVGVFVRAGAMNPELERIIQHLPKEEKKEFSIADERVNPAVLLPKNKTYFAFQGSLTTPPCTEGLQWIVMQDTITATPAQIQRLRRAAGGDNARPVQALNGRIITETQE